MISEGVGGIRMDGGDEGEHHCRKEAVVSSDYALPGHTLAND